VNVPQDELNGWRRALDDVRGLLNALRFDVAAGRTRAAREKVQRADDVARRLALRLEASGADRPAGTVRPPEVPLRLLDTPANRAYLDALEETHRRALAVDAERYGPHEDGPAAGMLELLLMEAREEVFGPAGRLRE